VIRSFACCATVWLLCVPAQAVAQGCTLSPGATIAFGAFLPFASTGDVTSHTAGTLSIRCDAGVSPSLHASSPRVLQGAGAAIAYRLSLSPGAIGDDLPSGAPGVPLQVAPETSQAVTIHGRIPLSEHLGKPAGHYAGEVLLVVEY
jgi:hypothetical protein